MLPKPGNLFALHLYHGIEFKRVEIFKLFRELKLDRLIDEFLFHDSLIQCFRFVVFLDGIGSDAFFINEFDRGEKEIVEEPPFVAVEIIHERDHFGIV